MLTWKIQYHVMLIYIPMVTTNKTEPTCSTVVPGSTRTLLSSINTSTFSGAFVAVLLLQTVTTQALCGFRTRCRGNRNMIQAVLWKLYLNNQVHIYTHTKKLTWHHHYPFIYPLGWSYNKASSICLNFRVPASTHPLLYFGLFNWLLVSPMIIFIIIIIIMFSEESYYDPCTIYIHTTISLTLTLTFSSSVLHSDLV